jgi:dimethylhistidine N-methyltransferase
MPVIAVCADYMQPLDIPGLSPFAAARRVVYFPGSTIGNLTPDEARDFLRDALRLVGPGGAMLVGVDLKKDHVVLHAAYNDAQGVTAQFNLNLLRRINRELGADFDLQQFRHLAFYDPVAGRIEMHLESICRQTVTINGHQFAFAAGERLHTENSYKYSIEKIQEIAAKQGLKSGPVWTDPNHWFGLLWFDIPDFEITKGEKI